MFWRISLYDAFEADIVRVCEKHLIEAYSYYLTLWERFIVKVLLSFASFLKNWFVLFAVLCCSR